jgi:hypothetical protein
VKLAAGGECSDAGKARRGWWTGSASGRRGGTSGDECDWLTA